MHTARSTSPVFALATVAALTFTPLATPSPAYRDIARPNTAACRQLAPAANPDGIAALADNLQCAQARPARQIAVQLAAETTYVTPSFGVADSHLYNLGPEELTARLTELSGLGVTDLRVAVPWVYIEPAAGTYDWSKMDALVAKATEMGFTLTGAVTATPTWAGLPLAGAPDPDTYGAFTGMVAGRYGSQITNYEVWNEPNGVMFYAPVSASGYTEMLKAAYTAIKAANPDAVVLAGSLGATTNVNGITVTPQRFLAEMYAAGAAGFFDALSYHPYHYTLPFSAGAGTTNAPLDQVRMLYDLMVANGDGGKQIWATEYGTATTPGWGVTQAEQAALLRDFLTAWSKLPYTGPAFVYTSQDAQTGILNHEFNFGLFTSNGAPKLAAQVLAELIAASGLGELPDYTAPRMSAARDLYLQLASVGFGLANTALIIPNAAIAVVYSLMPTPLKLAFNAVANAVSQVAGLVMTAVSPAVQAVIAAALNVGSALAGTGTGTAAEPEDQSTGGPAETADVAGDSGTGDAAQVSLAGTTTSAAEAPLADEPAAEQVSAPGADVVVDEQGTVDEPDTEVPVSEPVVADETETVTVDETEIVTDTETETETETVDETEIVTDTETVDETEKDEKSSDEDSAATDTEAAGTSKRTEMRADQARSDDAESGIRAPKRPRTTSASPQESDRSTATDRSDTDGSTRQGSGRDDSTGDSDSGASQ